MSADVLRWLLLPGLDGSGRLFRRFRPYLRDADVVVVEYPHEPSWSFDAYAAHAAEAIGDAHHCVVVAESFSGPIALRLQDDIRVWGVVLVASFVRRPNPLLVGLPLIPLSLARQVAPLRFTLRRFCVGFDASDDCVDELAEVVQSIPPATLRSRLALLADLKDSDRLRNARAPILHLRASRDRLVRAALSDERRVGRAFHETTIDGPHFLLQARPQACGAAIGEWAATLKIS